MAQAKATAGNARYAATERGKVTEHGRITAARSHSVNLNVSPA